MLRTIHVYTVHVHIYRKKRINITKKKKKKKDTRREKNKVHEKIKKLQLAMHLIYTRLACNIAVHIRGCGYECVLIRYF